MFGLQTTNGNALKDKILTWDSYSQNDKTSTVEEYSFEALSHVSKISTILNSIGQNSGQSSKEMPTSIDSLHKTSPKIEWKISCKKFNKDCHILTIELIPEYVAKS